MGGLLQLAGSNGCTPEYRWICNSIGSVISPPPSVTCHSREKTTPESLGLWSEIPLPNLAKSRDRHKSLAKNYSYYVMLMHPTLMLPTWISKTVKLLRSLSKPSLAHQSKPIIIHRQKENDIDLENYTAVLPNNCGFSNRYAGSAFAPPRLSSVTKLFTRLPIGPIVSPFRIMCLFMYFHASTPRTKTIKPPNTTAHSQVSAACLKTDLLRTGI